MDLQNLHNLVKEQGGCFFYSGPVLQDCIEGMAQTLIQVLRADGVDMKHAQSVFSVFIEMTQNIMKYSDDIRKLSDDEELMYGAISVSAADDCYTIRCGNLIRKDNVEDLKSRLDELIPMTHEEIRAFYKKRIYDKSHTTPKGAGLGLIEIAKLAKEPFSYEFLPVSDDVSYYILTAIVGGKSNV